MEWVRCVCMVCMYFASGECSVCQLPDCGECVFCRDMFWGDRPIQAGLCPQEVWHMLGVIYPGKWGERREGTEGASSI